MDRISPEGIPWRRYKRIIFHYCFFQGQVFPGDLLQAAIYDKIEEKRINIELFYVHKRRLRNK